jgi:hypothetical protein
MATPAPQRQAQVPGPTRPPRPAYRGHHVPPRRLDEAWLAETIHEIAHVGQRQQRPARTRGPVRHWLTAALRSAHAERFLLEAGARILGALDIESDPPPRPRECLLLGILADAVALRLAALRSERLLGERLQLLGR